MRRSTRRWLVGFFLVWFGLSATYFLYLNSSESRSAETHDSADSDKQRRDEAQPIGKEPIAQEPIAKEPIGDSHRGAVSISPAAGAISKDDSAKVMWDKFDWRAYVAGASWHTGEDKYSKNKFNQEVSDRTSALRDVPDTREHQCRSLQYDLNQLPDTSVIITFHNEARSTLVRTVLSVFRMSPYSLSLMHFTPLLLYTR